LIGLAMDVPPKQDQRRSVSEVFRKSDIKLFLP
jgi:hypothetical protein